MEKRPTIISLEHYRSLRAREARIVSPPSAGVQDEAGKLLQKARERLAGTSEDTYATRNEIHEDISFLTWFAGKIATARPGTTVDLRRTITDYGYDPEEEAADIASGLPYVPQADRVAADYQRRILTLSPLLRRLEGAGVRVKTGIKWVLPKADFDDGDE